MVSKEQRRHELARAKLARQQAKREADAKRRQLTAIIAAAVAVLLVVGAITYLSLNDDDGTTPAAGETTGPASSPSVSASPEGTSAPDGTCEYRPAGEAAKAITPPADGPAPVLASASATITTDQGVVEIELDPTAAPCTVQSFLTLADGAYYDSTPCHRLTTGDSLAVLQCGDPTGSGSGGPGYQYDEETRRGLTYDRGTVAMANAGPGTNGSQFFLVYGDSELPPDYTVFGTITSGLEALDAIAAAGVEGGGSDGAPATPVTIATVDTVATP